MSNRRLICFPKTTEYRLSIPNGKAVETIQSAKTELILRKARMLNVRFLGFVLIATKNIRKMNGLKRNERKALPI
jgi:hypothetical protein